MCITRKNESIYIEIFSGFFLFASKLIKSKNFQPLVKFKLLAPTYWIRFELVFQKSFEFQMEMEMELTVVYCYRYVFTYKSLGRSDGG